MCRFYTNSSYLSRALWTVIAPLIGVTLVHAQPVLLPQDNFILDHTVQINPPNTIIVAASTMPNGNVAIINGYPNSSSVEIVSQTGQVVCSYGTCNEQSVLGLSDNNVAVACPGVGVVLINSSCGFVRTLVPPGVSAGHWNNGFLVKTLSGALVGHETQRNVSIIMNENIGFVREWSFQPNATPPPASSADIAAIGENLFFLAPGVSGVRLVSYDLFGNLVNANFASFSEYALSLAAIDNELFFLRPTVGIASPPYVTGAYLINNYGATVGFYGEPEPFATGFDSVSSIAGQIGSQIIATSQQSNSVASSTFLVFLRRAYRTPNSLFVIGGAPPVPSVLSTTPEPGTTILDVTYIVNDADSAIVTTAPLAFLNGTRSVTNAVQLKTFANGTASNLGSGIATGVNKTFSWNAGTDLPGQSNFQPATISVFANDGRPALMDVHFITIPANVPAGFSYPALTISDTPIRQTDMLEAWFWLLATKDASINFSGGQITANGGAFSGQLLASGTTTTAAGIGFLEAKLNVRQATQAEVNRARSGSTNAALPGNQYEPVKRVGNNPILVNEIGFDTGATDADGIWVVPLP